MFLILFLSFAIRQQKNLATCAFSLPTNTAADVTIVTVSYIGILQRYFVEIINFILPKKVVKPINFNSIFRAVFPLTLWLVGECPNYLKAIVPKALKRRICALNFIPIQYQSTPNVIFLQICRIF